LIEFYIKLNFKCKIFNTENELISSKIQEFQKITLYIRNRKG